MTRAGVGKTYLAAFDSRNYRTVLFVAHREEILRQAAQTFRNVRDSEDYGFFDGDRKCTDKSVIFANVATLGQERYLTEEFFAPDRFEYVCIDEMHHAVTAQYQRIVRYFHPKFLLGLTATPDRMDGKDIYQICDYNVPYELSLRDAINKGVLVPFRYYGIFRNYLAYLDSLGRLTPEERELYGGPGRDFLHLLETTSMTKVYKMPVLRTFYHGGAVRMAVTSDQLLAEWKDFFGNGTNWKDLRPDGTYQEYLAITDKAHMSTILSNPVHFLQKSGNGFFVSKEGFALAIREDLSDIVKMPAFARQMGDIIDYRAMDNYEHFVLIISKPPVGGLSLSYRIRVRPCCARLPPSSDKIYYQRRYHGSLE